MISRFRPGGRVTLATGLIMLLTFPVQTLATASNWLPKGHYIAFDRERNLKTEMLDLVQRPETAQSGYHLQTAEDLADAFRTPGVKGLYMAVKWRTIETGDGEYDWSFIDDNMAAARAYGLKLVIKVSDRSFDGNNVLPAYFPSQYVLWYTGGGKTGVVAKRWDPYVYQRTIRLYKAIAGRYASDPGFGGIATTETASGNFGGDYSLEEYREALTQIVTQTQPALKNGRLFLYMNFIKGGDRSDMNEDARVSLLRDVPHDALVVGGPDITPDVKGMPRSASAYRIHVRKTMPSVRQFCHAQNVDQGWGGVNVKSNESRKLYFEEIATIREREQQSWFKGTPAVLETDDLRDPQGNKVDLHPESVLGDLWTPAELFSFATRNFGCDYFFWNHRVHVDPEEFSWPDVREVIVANQCFYDPNGCASAETAAAMPTPPSMF